MKELITRMVKALVENSDEVQITELDMHQTILFTLIVSKSDIGLVIGKQGRNINALRTILGVAAAKSRKRAVLRIKED
jgi:uncharacterized protein